MHASRTATASARAWWLAVAAAAACAPWPGWSPPWWAVTVTVAGLAAVARPRGAALAAWGAAAAVGVAAAIPARAPAPHPGDLERQLARHGRAVLEFASGLARDPRLQRLLAVTGEAVDPLEPFRLLAHRLRRDLVDAVLLADDRGRVVAWAGEETAPLPHVRPLGLREWSLEWTATAAVLTLREPVVAEGRLVGSLLVLQRAPLETREAFGIRAPRGWRLRLGEGGGAVRLAPEGLGGRAVPVRPIPSPAPFPPPLAVAAWLALLAAALAAAPAVAPAAALAGAWLPLVAPSPGWTAVWILAAAAAVTRAGAPLQARWRRTLAGLGLAGLAALAVTAPRAIPGGLVPRSALAPGPGAAVAVAAGWLAWLALARPAAPPLARRLAVAAAGAVGLAALETARLLALVAAPLPPPGPPLPRRIPEAAELLPVPRSRCRVEDLAVALARRSGLHRWRAPVTLVVRAADGTEASRWGTLPVPDEARRLLRRWRWAGYEVDIVGAAAPWGWLRDATPDPAGVWTAVLTRTGAVEASLHPELGGISAATAGRLYHDGGGWCWVRVGGQPRPARGEVRGEHLVLQVAPFPTAPEWALALTLSLLLGAAAGAVASPPRRLGLSLATFGGRLRLVIAAGVLVPLVILTAAMQEGLRGEEARRRRELGMRSLAAVRWTLEHLEPPVYLDDRLARSLAEPVGAEVTVFRGLEPVAASRRDRLVAGLVPARPLASAWANHLLGRTEAAVALRPGAVVASAPVPLAGERVLLQVVVPVPRGAGPGPPAADWQLAGAALAALLALALVGPVEARLGASLRELIAVARRVQSGEPLGHPRRPPERDLAEVLDAVVRMSEEVRRREARLREQEELLRTTLATVEPAVLLLGDDGEVRLANPSAERLLARHRAEVLDAVGRVAPGRGGAAVDAVRPHPGSDVTWRVAVAHARLPGGVPGTVAVIEDVTELVRADRLRQLTQLARIVAHEVKNPLTPIRLWVQEIEASLERGEGELREAVAAACREIREAVERLQATSQAFSNLVALERWEARPVDLAELAAEVLDAFRVAERRGVRLRLVADEGCSVVGDPTWLGRALSNLVRNSLEAVGEGEGEIAVRLQRRGDRVTLEVEDTGGGVPEDGLERLFEPHFSTTSGGSGLGLALVRMVASRLGGTVAARNGPRGLVVRLELPAA